MKILLIHNYYRFQGGEEVYLEKLAKLLRENGHNVRLFTKNNKEIEKFSLKEQIETAFGMFWNTKIARELSDVIDEFKPEIAHFNNIFPLITPTAYWLCKKKGVGIVQSIHSFRFMFPKSLLFRRGEICPYCLNKGFIQPAIFHKCFNESIPYTFFFSLSHAFHYLIGSFGLIDLFLFPSEFAKDYYLRNSGIKVSRSKVLPNFVETPKIKMTKRDGFIYVGTIAKQKGIFELLDTVSEEPTIKLKVVGGGPDANSLSKYKKFKHIIILGRRTRNEVFEYLGGSKACIVPSTSLEVMPTVVIEAFASGTPVVAPRLGVFKELVKEGTTGFFYKKGSKESLKRALFDAQKQLSSRKIGFAARQEFEAKYTKEKYYKGLMMNYEKLRQSSGR